MDGSRPPAGSLSSQAQSLAASKEEGTNSKYPENGLGPDSQSQLDREANYVEAADKIGSKIANDPESVTREDAAYVQSREHRAFGNVEAGGVASKAEKLASKNEQ
jgi:hypothetical protein